MIKHRVLLCILMTALLIGVFIPQDWVIWWAGAGVLFIYANWIKREQSIKDFERELEEIYGTLR